MLCQGLGPAHGHSSTGDTRTALPSSDGSSGLELLLCGTERVKKDRPKARTKGRLCCLCDPKNLLGDSAACVTLRVYWETLLPV